MDEGSYWGSDTRIKDARPSITDDAANHNGEEDSKESKACCEGAGSPHTAGRRGETVWRRLPPEDS